MPFSLILLQARSSVYGSETNEVNESLTVIPAGLDLFKVTIVLLVSYIL